MASDLHWIIQTIRENGKPHRYSRLLRRDAVEKIFGVSERLQQTAMTALLWSLALMGLVSLNPYFMWGHQKVYYAVVSALLVASLPGCYRLLAPSRFQVMLCAAFSVFLIYLSVLPKVDGGSTRWFFLIPFTVALIAISHAHARKAFGWFYWMFALSLVPGMLAWIWLAAGLPLELNYISLPADSSRAGIVHYFGVPGAVFISSNGVVLPSGGVVFRLCGIYDEPGTVGTIAALCLAATRYRLRDARGAICVIAGIMSFSVAFAALTSLGLLCRAVTQRQAKLAIAAALTILAGAVTLVGVSFQQAPPTAPNLTIVVPQSASAPDQNVETRSTAQKFNLDYSSQLRRVPVFDNRADPAMRELFDRFLRSPPSTLALGVASNASVIYGHESAVWYSVLTDYGVLGFVWVFLLYSLPVLMLWRAGRLDAALVVFCVLYLMSFYQRPIIWLPAQMLIYFAGIYWTAVPRHPVQGATPS